MTTPHPNADLLRAIADGKQMQGRVPEDGCDWFDIYPDQAIGAIAGVAETGNPKHAWDFLIAATRAA